MAFNFFVRKINVPEVVEPPKKKENLINADLLLMKIELLHEIAEMDITGFEKEPV